MEIFSGDSGGPLIIPDSPDLSITRGTPRLDILVALTSFGGEKCEQDGHPGGYTLVGPYLDWIESIVQSINNNKPEESVRRINPSCFRGRFLAIGTTVIGPIPCWSRGQNLITDNLISPSFVGKIVYPGRMLVCSTNIVNHATL